MRARAGIQISALSDRVALADYIELAHRSPTAPSNTWITYTSISSTPSGSLMDANMPPARPGYSIAPLLRMGVSSGTCTHAQ